jgi:hypothetical protein
MDLSRQLLKISKKFKLQRREEGRTEEGKEGKKVNRNKVMKKKKKNKVN